MALRRRAGLYRTLDRYRSGVAREPGLFGEASSQMEALTADLGLPEDRQDAMGRHVREVLGHAAVDGLMTDPARAARLLSDGVFDDVLPEPSKARRLGEAQAAVARGQRLTRERAVSDLTAQARQGTAPDEALLSAEKDGTLSAAEASWLRQANARAAEEASLRHARLRRVATATDPLDPSDSEDRAAVSDYWEIVAEVYASDDPDAQRDAELGFVLRTGVLPEGLRRQYQGALLSEDPALAVAGATALANLRRENPALVMGIPEDRLRRAEAIWRYAAFDLPPGRVIALAEKDLESESVRPASIVDADARTRNEEPAVQVAADNPPILSDAVNTGSLKDTASKPDESPPDVGRQLDGSVDITTGETVETTTNEERPDEAQAEPDSASTEEAPDTLEEIDWPDVERLQKILESDGEAAFVEAAEAVGLDPERVRLFLDVLVAKPEDGRRLRQQINKTYGSGYGLGVWINVQNLLRAEGGPEERKQHLKGRLWELGQDAPHVGERITDMLGPAMAPAFGRRMRRRGKPSGPGQKDASEKQPVKLEPGPGYRPDRKFIAPEEFRKLPEKGFIDPQRIRTSQRRFDEEFGKPFIRAVPESKKISFLVDGLKSGKIKPQDVDPIMLVEWHGNVYSVDHRRLIAFRRAGISIPFEKVKMGDLSKNKQDRIRQAPKFNRNGSYIPSEVTEKME